MNKTKNKTGGDMETKEFNKTETMENVHLAAYTIDKDGNRQEKGTMTLHELYVFFRETLLADNMFYDRKMREKIDDEQWRLFLDHKNRILIEKGFQNE